MMLQKIFLTALVVLLFQSCSSSNEQKTNIIDTPPDSLPANAYYQKAVLLSKDISLPSISADSQQLIQAISFLDTAISINNKIEYQILRAKNKTKLGNLNEAYQDFENAIKIDSLDEQANFLTGLLNFYLDKNDYNKFFERAIYQNESSNDFEQMTLDINNTYCVFMMDSVKGKIEFEKVTNQYSRLGMNVFALNLNKCSRKDVVFQFLFGGIDPEVFKKYK